MTTTIVYLDDNDFSIKEGKHGPVLCHNITGFSLVMFYSPRCKHSESLLPVFKGLPSSIGGCKCILVNVSQFSNIVRKSRATIDPIEHVPYIILYVDGRPWMRYDGPHTESDIRTFVFKIEKTFDRKRKFATSQPIVTPDTSKDIPEYSLGIPKSRSQSKYLAWDSAYGGDAGSSSGTNGQQQQHQ